MAKKKKEGEELEEGEIEEVKDKKQYFVIEEADFKMESSAANDLRFFDLYFMHTVNKGKATEREEFKLEGYGIQLKNCLKRIAYKRSQLSDKRLYTSFKEFVIDYQKQVKEIKALFDLLPQDFN